MRGFDGTHAVPDEPAMQFLQRQNTADLSASEAQALALARAQHQADYGALVASRQPSLQTWLSSTSCN